MTMTCEIEAAHFRECEALREERNRAALTEREKLVPRIRELEAENDRLRAALAKISAVTMREYHRIKAECDRRKAELDILWNLCRSLGCHEEAMAASKFPKGGAS